MKKTLMISILIGIFCTNAAIADELLVQMFTTDNQTPIGKISFHDTKDGLLITPTLKKLPPGTHGFHVHSVPDCKKLGMNAGDHYDPKETDTHQGPLGNGHLGDLPVLIVDNAGDAKKAMLAPRLKTSDLKNKAIIIHAGSDNYSDNPKLGGGGERIACGVTNH